LRHGTLFRQLTPGGGGYGDPLERDPAAVAADLRNEYITPEQARDVYGVVLDAATGAVDEPATLLRRRALRPRAAGD
jgi:N-methylhydantoinase B